MPTAHEPGLTKVTLIDTAGDVLSTTGGKLDVNAVLAAGGTVTADQGDPNADATKAWGVQLSTGVAFYNAPTSAQLPSTIGQKTAALSLGTAFASDQVGTAGAPSTTVVSVQGVGGGTSLPVSGTVTANLGTTAGGAGQLALDATLAKLTIAQGTALGANTQALAGGSVTTSAPSYTTGQISPLSLTTAGELRVREAVAPSAAAITSVTAGIASATVVASNASRKGLNIHNNSTAGLYLRYSASAAAATTGNYTVYLAAGAYWEMPRTGPFVEYTGELTGIWTAANGGASVTEIT